MSHYRYTAMLSCWNRDVLCSCFVFLGWVLSNVIWMRWIRLCPDGVMFIYHYQLVIGSGTSVILVKLNWIRNLIHACILLLFANSFDVEQVTYMHLSFDDIRYSPDPSRNVNYFFVPYVQCGLYELNRNNSANAAHLLSPVQRKFRDRTEVTSSQSSSDQDLDLF